MPDLYIDGQMLENVKTNFRNIENLLGTPTRTMKNIDARDVGPGELVDRVREFGDGWGHGIGELGEFSAGVVSALQSIADAFETADTELADALEEAMAED